MISVSFQNVSYSEMYQNNIFYFFKIIFDINTSKLSENIAPTICYNINSKIMMCNINLWQESRIYKKRFPCDKNTPISRISTWFVKWSNMLA